MRLQNDCVPEVASPASGQFPSRFCSGFPDCPPENSLATFMASPAPSWRNRMFTVTAVPSVASRFDVTTYTVPSGASHSFSPRWTESGQIGAAVVSPVVCTMYRIRFASGGASSYMLSAMLRSLESDENAVQLRLSYCFMVGGPRAGQTIPRYSCPGWFRTAPLATQLCQASRSRVHALCSRRTTGKKSRIVGSSIAFRMLRHSFITKNIAKDLRPCAESHVILP
mmetsp:Transcript_36820/g.113623  ORF Transcript_36820/g.113623 Transcript_36820/m.113623 type:complete len:225 (+) Transcript_36820:609-1283(+)